jgi:hypothetical protein
MGKFSKIAGMNILHQGKRVQACRLGHISDVFLGYRTTPGGLWWPYITTPCTYSPEVIASLYVFMITHHHDN